MPATGATRKEPENNVNPGGRPGFGKGGCSDAATGLQQRSFREGARRSRSGLSNGPQGPQVASKNPGKCTFFGDSGAH